LVVVVEGVEKPGNLGAVLRTCDGAAVDALFVSDSKTDIFNPNVIRSSIGAVFSVPVVSGTNRQIGEYLREKKIFILATSPQGKQSYWNTDFKGPVALVLGSEKEGLSDFWINEADVQVSIPMKGKADSLNVSTTAAILMYEVIRQRR
jgi:TrmH family RNA methyltransferase